MYPIPQILALASTYSERTGAAMSSISLYCSGSGATFTRLRNGHNLTVAKACRMLQWFSDHWPPDAPWPPEVPRPNPAPDSPAIRALAESLNIPAPGAALTALDANGHVADVDAWLEALNEGRLYVVLRPTYEVIIRQYADGRPRARQWPRKGSKARLVLDALLTSGDARFAERAALTRRALGQTA